MVEIDPTYIIGIAIALQIWVLGNQRRIWHKLCKLARVVKRVHPTECEAEEL